VKQDIFFFNTWYRGHNNVRYAELLPRLDRVHSSLLTFPRSRVLRVVAERAWRGTRGVLEPAILRREQARFPYAFVTGLDQLASLTVPAVVDVDDPRFEQDALLLEQPNVAAYVVTDESAARTFEQLGVTRPWHVISQGVALDKLDPGEVERVAREHRSDGAPVAGYVAAFLLLPGDRGGDNPLYDVSHLLELWDEIVKRRPDARLWLIGAPSVQLRERLADRGDIQLTGRLPPKQLLARVANLDVALYPRLADQGVRAVKIAEYLGLGVPIVSYDWEVVADVREARAGLLVTTPEGFVEAVARLLGDPASREPLAAAARVAGAKRDWRLLARRYAEIIDEHLPPYT
jgi:glycosyltransferase involved in cell wall biosynthesis